MRAVLCCFLLLGSVPVALARPSLHELARDGHAQTAAAMIERSGRSIHRRDKYGNTPLHYAAGRAHPDVVILLLESGADADARNQKYDTTPLHEIARTSETHRQRVTATANLLIANGADARAVDAHGENPLLAAARVGNAAVVKVLLDTAPFATSTEILEQALLSAREHSRFEVIALLEGRGVASKMGRESGLLNAASLGEYAVAENLINAGADLDTVNDNAKTPLMLASARGHLEIVRLLLSSGAALESVTEDGRTALHLAAAASNTEIVELLVENGANVNAHSPLWGTAANSAANAEAVNLVDLLLEAGGKPVPISDTAERSFGSGLALRLFAEREADRLTVAERDRYYAEGRTMLQTARSQLENEKAEHEALRRKKQRSDAFCEAVGTAIAAAAVTSLQYLQQQHVQATRKQTAQIAALKDATSYEDYHARYALYKDIMVDSTTDKPYQLDFTDTTLANTSSVSGLDVIIGEYERRIALTDKLLEEVD